MTNASWHGFVSEDLHSCVRVLRLMEQSSGIMETEGESMSALEGIEEAGGRKISACIPNVKIL